MSEVLQEDEQKSKRREEETWGSLVKRSCEFNKVLISEYNIGNISRVNGHSYVGEIPILDPKGLYQFAMKLGLYELKKFTTNQ